MAHVMTASELLSNSLVRIEQPDVVLDEALIDAEVSFFFLKERIGWLLIKYLRE